MGPNVGRTDPELVADVRRGHREAFGALVARYRDAVYGRAQVTPPGIEVEDAIATLRARLAGGV